MARTHGSVTGGRARSTTQHINVYTFSTFLLFLNTPLLVTYISTHQLPTHTLSIALSLSRTKQSPKTKTTKTIWQSESNWVFFFIPENFNHSLVSRSRIETLRINERFHRGSALRCSHVLRDTIYWRYKMLGHWMTAREAWMLPIGWTMVHWGLG